MNSSADAPGMTASQNALGLLTYSATNTLVELPSGWLADTIGRKQILSEPLVPRYSIHSQHRAY
jgi:hypothetical protein